MPQVPALDAPQVGQAPVPGVRLSTQASPAAFGSSVGAGVSDIAQVRGQVIEQQNQVAVQDAGTQRQAWENEKLYGPDGALAKKGKDALAARDTALSDYDQTAGKIQQGLANDQQKLEFQRQSAAHRALIQRTLDQHVAGQLDELDQQTTFSTVANSKNAAIANSNDPKRVGAEIALQQATIRQFAKRRGLPAEWVDLHTQEAASDTHVGVIDRMMANEQDQAAKAYYEANKDQVVGSARPQIEKALEIGSTRAESQKQSDAIVLSAKDQVEALAKANAIPDPRLRDEVVVRVMQHYSQLHAAQSASWEDAYNKGIQALTDPQNDQGINGVPANVIAAMGPHQEAFEKFAAWKAAGKDVVTDQTVKYGLLSAANDPQTREGFVNTFLPAFRAKLAPADYDQVVNLQMELKKARTDRAEQERALAGVSTREQVVKEALGAIDKSLLKNNNDLTDPKAVKFRSALDRAVIAEEAQRGKKLNVDEVRTVASKLIADVAYQGTGFWGQTTTKHARMFEAPGAEKLAYDISHVPAADLQAIKTAAASNGKRLSDDQIVDIYNQNTARKAAGWKPPVVTAQGKPAEGDDGEGFGIPIGNESPDYGADEDSRNAAPLIGNE